MSLNTIAIGVYIYNMRCYMIGAVVGSVFACIYMYKHITHIDERVSNLLMRRAIARCVCVVWVQT